MNIKSVSQSYKTSDTVKFQKKLTCLQWASMFCYCKDRFNNSVSLSLSVCTKRSVLFGWRNSTVSLYKQCQTRFGISSLGRNKDQLLHRIQRLGTFTNLQYCDKEKFDREKFISLSRLNCRKFGFRYWFRYFCKIWGFQIQDFQSIQFKNPSRNYYFK